MEHLHPLTSRAQDELLSLPMRHLAELPLGVRITAYVSGITEPIALDSREGLALPEAPLRFSGDELRALALGVEAERLLPGELKGLCLRKLHDPGFRLDDATALDGAQPLPRSALSVSQVFERLELEPTAAVCVDQRGEDRGSLSAYQLGGEQAA